MRRLTLCVLLDAFRPDYLRHAPYLRAIAGDAPAELREPFGFLPRAAYFGGLTPEQVGFTNMYVYDPEDSPFGMARAFNPDIVATSGLERLGVRAAIDATARAASSPFARAYASSAMIPLDLLPSFSLAEQLAPWDAAVGYRSIFHELDERHEEWFEYAWPGTNTLPDRSDRGIVRSAIAKVTSATRFAFVHLQELDSCGHEYGPDSPETRDRVRATDALVEELVETLDRRSDALDALIFGDHGMVSVTRTVDVNAKLRSLPLALGRDYTCFLDSTMVRVWSHTGAARDSLPLELDRVPGARVLSQDDLRRFHVAGCDRRNGELFLLADPGVVFLPNFFQGDRQTPLGMHGYDPDCPDNHGVLIAISDLVAPPAGVVDATSLHSLLRTMLFDSRPAATTGKGTGRTSNTAALTRPAAPPFRRFTCVPDLEANRAASEQLQSIAQAVLKVVPHPRAILLTGSFGRGHVSRHPDVLRTHPAPCEQPRTAHRRGGCVRAVHQGRRPRNVQGIPAGRVGRICPPRSAGRGETDLRRNRETLQERAS